MKKNKRVVTFALYAVFLLSISYLLAACRKESYTENSSAVNIPEEYTIEAPDADAYYEQNSEIVTVIDAKDSDEVLTEAKAFSYFTGRGFTQFPVTSCYSMGGEYYDAEDVDTAGKDRHPIYETYYVTDNGDIWTIFMINGVIMANPVSYNLQSGLGVQVMISESDTIMSYDSTTNKFFETIPDKSALLVVTVEKIDATLLETLTVEEIDGYVN